MTDPSQEFPRLLSLRDLPAREGRTIVESATDDERAAIAAALDLHALPSLAVEARLQREGESGWRLEGRVRADVVQACVVTLDPVEARIEEPFLRRFQPVIEGKKPAANVVEVILDPLADDPPEPLGDGVDLGAVALETLALALDPYPRAPGAVFTPRHAPPPGVAPLTDEAIRPFAALAALKEGGRDDA